MVSDDPRWNLNIHYHRVVLDAIPRGARTALDVGCGDGLLSFDIAARGLLVTGLDNDAASIRRATSDRRASEATQFVVGDLFTVPLRPESFDLVASIAMLHHVDARAGLRRMRQLVPPGGVLVIVGFATASGIWDRARAVAGMVFKWAKRLTGGYWEHQAPVVWPPPLSSVEMADLVRDELPGATFENALSNRYNVVWTRSMP